MSSNALQDFGRTLAGVLAIPVGAVATALHRWGAAPGVVLELRVRHWDDLAARTFVLRRVRRAAADPTVAALWLRVDGPPGGWASCQDLRSALARFRAAGKRVYALVEAPGNAATWIAAAAERVFVVPMGEVGLVGVGVEMVFVGEALDRIGLSTDFEAAGAYKSFGETWQRRFASPENLEAVTALVEDLQAQLVADVAASRGLDRDVVRGALARAPLTPEEARDVGLVDQIAYEDEVKAWIEREHGKGTKFQSFASWARRDAILEWIEHWGAERRVAVVTLQGAIVMDDDSPAQMIRARRVVSALHALTEDAAVRAVVLHVNSPGGNALASDLIWREVDRMRRAKPVIACFEDVAASGGYYLAAPAAEIVSRPATLTGSIGVFGGKVVAAEGLRRLGVHTQEVSAAPNAALFSATAPFTDAQRTRFRAMLQRFYDGFVERVATGRKRPLDVIEPHCRGRVWTGRLASDRGLVDHHGDVFDAIERARLLAGLSVGGFQPFEVSVGTPRTWFSRLVAAVLREARPRFGVALPLAVVDRLFGAHLVSAEMVVRESGQPLAMLPFDLRIR